MIALTVVAVCCLLVGQISGDCTPPHHVRYDYNYSGIIVTTLTTPTPQYAGIYVDGEIYMDSISPNSIKIGFEKADLYPINNVITNLDPREFSPRAMRKQTFDDLTKYDLEAFYDNDGTITSVMCEPEDSVTSCNMKKAIASLFQFPIKGERNEHASNVKKGESRFFRTEEESLAGNCDVNYHIVNVPWVGNGTAKVMNMTKTIDMDSCDYYPEWFRSTHQARECDDCEGDSTEIVSSNMIIDIDSVVLDKGDYLIEEIDCQAQTIFAPLGYDTDKKIMEQRLVLTYMGQSASSYSSGSTGPRPAGASRSLDPYFRYKALRKYYVDPIKLDEPNLRLINYDEEEDSYVKLVEPLIEEAMKIFHDKDPVTNRELPSLMMRIVKGMENFDYSELKSFSEKYAHVRFADASLEDATKKQIYIDCLSICGTNPCFKMAIELIKEGLIIGERAAQLIQAFPTHLKEPTPVVLDKFMEFCSHDTIIKDRHLAGTCYIAWATAVGHGCSYGVRGQSLPPGVENPCTNQKLKSYVKHLASLMEHERRPGWKLHYITALGKMATMEIFPYIRDCANGKNTGPYSDLVQIKCIYALKLVGMTNEKKIIDFLLPVLYDSNCNSTVRIAAFDTIIAAHPTYHIFEKMATYSWYEDDDQLKAYMYSTFSSLANTTHPCLKKMSSHASHAIELMDDEDEGGWGDGYHNYFEKLIDDTGLATTIETAFAGEDSSIFVPSKLYAAWKRYILGYRSTWAEISMNTVGLRSLFGHTIGPEGAFKRKERDIFDILQDVDADNVNKGFTDVLSALGIEPLTDDDTKILITMTFLNSQTRQFYWDMPTIIERAKEWVNWAVQFRNKHSVKMNWQKITRPFSARYAWPTILGLKGYIDVSKYNIFSAVGDLSMSLERGSVELESTVRPMTAGRLSSRMGLIIPKLESNKPPLYAVAGYHTLHAVSLPYAFKVKLDYQTYNFRFEAEPLQTRGAIPLIFAKTMPFTAMYPYCSLEPMNDHGRKMTILDSRRSFDMPIGENILKNPLFMNYTFESFWNSKGSMYRFLKHHGVMGLWAFTSVTKHWRLRTLELVSTNPTPVSIDLDVDWEYKPAETEIKWRPLRSILGIWGRMFGWGRMPSECEDVDSNVEPWNMKSSISMSKRVSRRPSHESVRTSFDSEIDRLSLKRVSYRDESEDVSSRRKPSSRYEAGRYRAMLRADESFGRSNIVTIPFGQGESVGKIHLMLKCSGLKAEGLEVDITCKHDYENTVKTLKMETKLLGSQKKVCVDAKLDYVKPPCYYGKMMPQLITDEQVEHTMKVSWGEGECSPSNFVEFETVLKKSDDQLEYDQRDSDAGIKPWFYKQCEDDMAEDNYVSYACEQMISHQAELHLLVTKIKYENPPMLWRKAAVRIDNFMKYMLYPHMENNPIEVWNPKKQIKIVHLFHYEVPASTITIYKPYETTRFHKFYYDGSVLPLAGPPTTRDRYRRILAEYYAGDDFVPTCSLAEQWVNTFDNTTYNMKYTDCKYVAAKDCAGSNLFSVMVLKEENHKILIVRALKHEVRINPSSPEREVILNGQVLEVDDDSAKQIIDEDWDKTVMIVVKTTPVYNVILPHLGLRMKFDGLGIIISATHLWRGKVCGLCGTFNGNDDVDLIGPGRCKYSDGPEFAKSYAVPDGACSAPRVTEDKLCDENPNTVSINANYNLIYRNIKARNGTKHCYSIEAYPACKQGSKPTLTKTHDVDMTCYSEDDSRISEWDKLIKERPLSDFYNEVPDFTKECEINHLCSAE